jgi:integrase
MRLQEIGLVNIEQYKAEKIKKGLKPKTINNHLAALSKCLSCAHEWGRMDSPPPKIKRLSAHSGRIDFLTPIESGQLLKDQKAPDWNLMVLLGLRTGMRFGELLGLDWTDIDWERKQLTVRQSLVRGVMGTPKSGKMRHIPMTKDLYEALSDRRKIRGLIFERPQGEKSTHRVATNALNQICKRTGVRKFGWHILRHTFASHLAMEGVALPYIQQLMGHASIIMTMRYAHLMPSKLNEAIEVLDTFEKRELAKYGQQVGNVAIKRCVSEVEARIEKTEIVAQP